MKQASKKVIESLMVVSLAMGMYYPSVNQINNLGIKLSTTAGAVEILGDYESNISATAGAINVIDNLLIDEENYIENHDTDSVGIPLEEAEMNDEGEVVSAEFEPYTMYVTPSFLNVRSTPSTEEENVIGKLNINDEILVIGECEDNWAMINYNDTIGYISSEFIQDTLPENDTYNYNWTGKKLNKHDGVCYGPSGKETYYNLNMSKCIYYMQRLGYYEKYWVRSDGVKMYGNSIMIATDLNKYPKGTLVETSLGTGIVVDTGDFCHNGSGVVLDIATTWGN